MMSVWDFLMANQNFLKLESFSAAQFYYSLQPLTDGIDKDTRRNEILARVMTSLLYGVIIKNNRKVNLFLSFFNIEDEEQKK